MSATWRASPRTWDRSARSACTVSIIAAAPAKSVRSSSNLPRSRPCRINRPGDVLRARANPCPKPLVAPVIKIVRSVIVYSLRLPSRSRPLLPHRSCHCGHLRADQAGARFTAQRAGSPQRAYSEIRQPRERKTSMGIGDKISNKAQEAKGKVKESVGEATDNRDLEAEGKKDQAAADVKQAGENVKDAARDATDRR